MISRSPAVWVAADWRATFAALYLGGDELATLARHRLAAMLQTAAGANFYRERFEAAGIQADDPQLLRDPERVLRSLPLASKQELRDAAAAALVGGRVEPGWRSSRSSGSTGEPFQVYYDPRAWAVLKYLVKLRARLECGMRLTDRVASLEALPTAELDAHQASRHRRLMRLNVLRPAADVADALLRGAPDILTGLPSALLEAGGALEASGRRLAVRAVFTGGELMPPGARASLEQRYGAPVFDVYGTSETKEIAWECRLGGMHINADVVYLEIIDEDGRPLPPGHDGEIVATLLVNRAMPLLRYRTGDWGHLRAEHCPCGRATPLLGVGTGREAETLMLAGGRRISPYALTCTLEQVPGLARYQVVQLAPDRLTIRAMLGAGADRQTVAHGVRTTLHADVASFLDIQIEFVERFPAGPRAKFRVVQRLEGL